MSFIDPVGDMLNRIRNGQMRSLNQVKIPASSLFSDIIFLKPIRRFSYSWLVNGKGALFPFLNWKKFDLFTAISPNK